MILDEVHHAGDGLSWGDAVAAAFELAARRVCLTGTPFRTRPDERIPFVRYDDDVEGGLRSAADFTYGYREALRDGVVRPVVFAAYTGTSRWRNSAGEVIAATLSENATKSTEATAWRTALNPRGKWVPHVIAAMDERITHLRATGMPDAAGLVLASDQDDARAYAEIVEQVTGEAPVVILSDDPKASDKIAAFTTGTQRMAVCVRMVSEGVDVPRAACLAWMTSYRTPLFFAQGVGPRRARPVAGTSRRRCSCPPCARCWRWPPSWSTSATTSSRRPPRPARSCSTSTASEPEPGGARRAPSWSTPTPRSPTCCTAAAPSSPGRRRRAERGRRGLPRACPASCRRSRPRRCWPAATRTPAAGPAGTAEARAGPCRRPGPVAVGVGWRAGAELRREVNRLVGVLAARTGTPHGQVHAELRRAVPGPASAAASAEVLERRRDHLMELLGGRPGPLTAGRALPSRCSRAAVCDVTSASVSGIRERVSVVAHRVTPTPSGGTGPSGSARFGRSTKRGVADLFRLRVSPSSVAMRWLSGRQHDRQGGSALRQQREVLT